MQTVVMQLAGGSWLALDIEDFRAALRRGAQLQLDQRAIAAPAPTAIEDDVLKPDQAAELLQVSRSTVLRQAKSGAIPSMGVGRNTRFLRSDLLRLSRSADCSSARGTQGVD